MGVPFEDASTFPFLVPIPEFDCHVIGTGQDKRLSWMDRDTPNVTRIWRQNDTWKWSWKVEGDYSG